MVALTHSIIERILGGAMLATMLILFVLITLSYRQDRTSIILAITAALWTWTVGAMLWSLIGRWDTTVDGPSRGPIAVWWYLFTGR